MCKLVMWPLLQHQLKDQLTYLTKSQNGMKPKSTITHVRQDLNKAHNCLFQSLCSLSAYIFRSPKRLLNAHQAGHCLAGQWTHASPTADTSVNFTHWPPPNWSSSAGHMVHWQLYSPLPCCLGIIIVKLHEITSLTWNRLFGNHLQIKYPLLFFFIYNNR